MYFEDTLNELKFHVTGFIGEEENRDPAHGADHILRVYDTGMRIGSQEGANLKILGAALLFHDVIRPTDVKGEADHAKKSAVFARGVLSSYGYSKKEIEMVEEAIITGSRSGGTGKIPATLEAKIAYDADKIDGGGEIGIQRTTMMQRKRAEDRGDIYDEKEAMRWYLGRITDVLNIGLFTKYGREMMNEGLKVSLSYINKVLGSEFEEIMKRDLGEKSKEYFSLIREA